MDALIAPLKGLTPDLADDAYVAPGAVVLGNVVLGARASVWYGSVLRGDDERIDVAEDVNIQDGCIVHADEGVPAVLGERVSLGHGATVHGALVEADTLIGIRATVLNECRIGSGSIVAAGAVVRPGTEVPPGSLVVGVPGKVRREVTEDERAMIARTWEQYVAKARMHRDAHAAAGGRGPAPDDRRAE